MPHEDLILRTHALTKSFKGFSAVTDVNLEVRRGSLHALIGPNGAGKTTCFNLLTKFLTPSAGSIVFNGIDITREKPAQIARRGVIRSLQISAVFPHLTARQNVPVALQRRSGMSWQFWRSARECRRIRIMKRCVSRQAPPPHNQEKAHDGTRACTSGRP